MDLRKLLLRKCPPAPRVPGATFDVDRVLRVERFFRKHLRLTKAEWAGQPFVLEPWQLLEVIAPLFGYVDGNGNRIYREGYVAFAKKNGKSPLGAGLALYLLTGDQEPGAEVYAAAGDKDQARIVFGGAKAMALASPLLSNPKVCRIYRDVIHWKPTDSTFRVLSSDAPLKDGLQPHGAIVDELHAHKSGELFWFLRQGTVARRQPMTLNLTTAGGEDEDDPEAPQRSIALARYLHGKSGKDPRFFFLSKEAPRGCKLTDFAAFKAANPASWRQTKDAHREVLEMGIPEWRARRFYFNQWVAAESDPAIPLVSWDRCKAKPKLTTGTAWLGVDAALSRDKTGVMLNIFDAETRTHNWLLHVFEKDERTGQMPFDEIEELILQLAEEYQIQACGYDRFAFGRSAQILDEEGVPMVVVPQRPEVMSPASQIVFDAVMEGRLRHGGDPQLRAMVQAAVPRESDYGWRFDKRRSKRSIDGLIAGTIAAYLAENDGDAYAEPTVLVGGNRA